MRKFILLMSFVSLILGCSREDENLIDIESLQLGRWHLVGFEETVMYEFTSELRYTIYSIDGTFGDIDTAIPNPNNWTYDGENLVVDLNFGNFFIARPEFRCDSNVLDLVNEQGTTTLFREGYSFLDCNQ